MYFKKLTTAAFITLFFTTAFPILAVDRGIRPTIKAERQELRTTITQNRNDLKATTAQTRLESNRKHIQATYQGLYNSFTKRIETLKSYLARIQTRLDNKKIKLPGNQNLTDAQTALDNVTKVLIPKFDIDLAAFKTQADLILALADPKSMIPQLKTAAKLVQTDLKDVRRELVNALRLIVKAK